MPQRLQLTEAAEPLTPVSRPKRQPDGSLKFRARLLEANRWGSKAFYGEDPVRRDGPKVFPAGTHMYADHPTNSEKYDRPERSIRDLAGRIETTPVYEAAHVDDAGKAQPAGLYAEVRVNAASAEVIESRWKDIGLSIRADAEAEPGTVDGRTGLVVTRFIESGHNAVDFVTKPGAGGVLLSLMESVREADAVPPTRLSEALPGGLTFTDLRQGLRELVRELTSGVNAYSELEDFDDERVIFRVNDWSADKRVESTWSQGYSGTDAGALELTGSPTQVRRVTTYVAVPADDPAATALPTSPRTTTVVGSEAAAVAEADTPSTATPGGTPVGQISVEESEYKALQGVQQRFEAQEAENRRLATDLARRDAKDLARPIVTQLLSESTVIPAGWQAMTVEEALAAVPLTSDLKLDESALRGNVASLRSRDETRIAQLAEANGAGSVTGGGQTTSAGAAQSAPTAGASAGGGTAGGEGTQTVLTQESARDRILAMRGLKVTG